MRARGKARGVAVASNQAIEALSGGGRGKSVRQLSGCQKLAGATVRLRARGNARPGDGLPRRSVHAGLRARGKRGLAAALTREESQGPYTSH